jgi:signal transduction histidine kinase
MDIANMSNENLQQRLEMRERQLNAVHQISAALFSVNDLDTLLRQTLLVSLETVDADAGSLLLYDPDRRKLVFRYVKGATELTGREIDPDDPNARASIVFREGVSRITEDTRKGYNPTFDKQTGYQTRNMLTVPLKTIGGETIGVMQALNRRRGVFSEDDQELLEIVSAQAATIITNARLAEEAQLAAVTRAVGDVAHDIKNYLTPIETEVMTLFPAFIAPMYEDLDRLMAAWEPERPEMAQALREAVDPLREYAPEAEQGISDGCADIREMVSEIADYIKGAQSTNIEVSDLAEVIPERLRRLRTIARNRNVTIHLEGLDGVPPFPFDRRLIGRAIYNLVNNALGAINDAVKKKTLEYRPFHIHVCASARTEGAFPDGHYCLIEVQDDGPGIPARVKGVLFTPQAVSTTPGGTGIGTRFVRSVADAHGGAVGVESEEGKGARFWMKLPLG